MPIRIDDTLTARNLGPKIDRLFELSAQKLAGLEKWWDPSRGAPVFTVKGRYASRNWTEWTQGFQYGSALLQFDATDDRTFLESGRTSTIRRMAPHLSHTGVHDHGFNNVSTYGNLLRLMEEGRIPANDPERELYKLALKVSGAVQAARWSKTAELAGYVYSFNGPHSLFIDTMRSMRSLAIAHRLGHVLLGEHDEKISLLVRLLLHCSTTARYAIYYGEGRDLYDLTGRTAQESIFNITDGRYRCPNSHQGYSPFSTWTRGLGWALLGFAEQLEFLRSIPPSELRGAGEELTPTRAGSDWFAIMERAARATADYCLEISCTDGIPLWDSHAPNLHRMGDFAARPSDPYNTWEPVDSSAAAILAQGLLRLGRYLLARGDKPFGTRYRQAGLTITGTLLQEPYLSTDPKHQGLLLHSVYHRPNGWDFVHRGQKIPNGESSMWGDYHLRELALLVLRETSRSPYLTFFGSKK